MEWMDGWKPLLDCYDYKASTMLINSQLNIQKDINWTKQKNQMSDRKSYSVRAQEKA